MAEKLDSRSLRHRRRLRRPVGRGCGGGARRSGGADREGQDGRRMPQHRLRAFESAARRRPACRGVPGERVPSVSSRSDRMSNFEQVHDRMSIGVIAAIAPNDSRERFTGLGVQVIEGEARFRDTRTVVVQVGDEVKFEISARRFVIATGSSPTVPPIPGFDQVPYLTNETMFERARAPEASDHHRRRTDRDRARAGVPPARLRGDGARSSDAARQRGSRVRRSRARCAGTRGRDGSQRRVRSRGFAARSRPGRGRAGRSKAARRPSKAATFWLRPAVALTSTTSTSRPRTSGTTAAGIVVDKGLRHDQQAGLRDRRCGRLARSSPMSPTITPGW